MELYFLRHAHAEEGLNIPDHDRQLTEEGVQAANAAMQVLRSLALKLDHLYSSPRVRARQTAEIVGRGLNVEVTIQEALNFDFNMHLLRQMLVDAKHDAVLMFVGHEPTFSQVVGELTGARVQMRKSGLARIDIPDAAALYGELVWLVTPKIFRAVTG